MALLFQSIRPDAGYGHVQLHVYADTVSFASVAVLSLMAIGLMLMTGSFFLLVKVPIVTAIFNGCMVLGAGMAVFMAGFDLSKLIFRIFLRYFKWNVSIVRRETIESKNVV